MYTLEIIPGLYQITVRYTNMFLITERSLTLIDAGFRGSMPYVFETIHKLGREPAEIGLVILTHNHLDHTGGLDELRTLASPRVAAHRADVHIPEDTIPYPGGNYIGKLLKTPVFSRLRRHLVLDGDSIDIKLEGGETFDILGGLQIVPVPGHTPGSISLYFPVHKILVVGDALAKRRNVVFMPRKTVSTDLKEAANSLRKIAGMEVKILLFGHGRPITVDPQGSLKRLAEKLGVVQKE
ncbi:MAG: MBL fold metallo-hydrolase [Dehalococcoidia bacterium]|nr:MBL fold metallo-hydrolase [Dehalococcoidia bacterium]